MRTNIHWMDSRVYVIVVVVVVEPFICVITKKYVVRPT